MNKIFLNKKERNLLKLFISNIGKSISYEEIENRMDTINKKFKVSYIVGGIALVISILEFFIIWS